MSKPLFPQVSRDTFLFPEPTMAALGAIFMGSPDVRQIVRITQEEYDLIPTPRPGDVLYVVVPN